MANKNNLNLIRAGKTIFWKNNIIYTLFYSKLFFQIILIKKIIKFFLLRTLFLSSMRKKKTFIYLSQIWLNSLNSNIFISLNFCHQLLYFSVDNNVIVENYLRLRYFYYFNIKNRYF